VLGHHLSAPAVNHHSQNHAHSIHLNMLSIFSEVRLHHRISADRAHHLALAMISFQQLF